MIHRRSINLGFLYRLSRRVSKSFSYQEMVSLCLLVLFIMVSVRYCDLFDYKAYYLSYNQEHKMAIEIGYTVLADSFYLIGCPFYVFYGLIISVSLIVLWRFIVDYSYNPLFVCLVFFIYPYINVVQQIRSFASMIFILTGLRFMFAKGNEVAFIVFVFLAMLFHTTAFVYLIFIWAYKASFKSVQRIVIVLYLFGLPLLYLLRTIVYLVFPKIPYFSIKYLKYINNDTLFAKSTIVDWTIFLMILLVTTIVIKLNYSLFSYLTQSLIRISYVIIALSLLRGLGNNGYRIALMAYPLIYIMMDRVACEANNRKTAILLYTTMIGFSVLSVFIWWGPLNPAMFEKLRFEMWRVWSYYY